MSDNKFKYFTVTTTSLVKANNKADAAQAIVAQLLVRCSTEK